MITARPSDATSYGRAVKDLQSGITVDRDYVVHGTLHYVTGMSTAFPGNPDGNFLSLDLVCPKGATVKLKGPTSDEKTLDPDDHELLLKVASTEQEFTITVNDKVTKLSTAGLTLEQKSG